MTVLAIQCPFGCTDDHGIDPDQADRASGFLTEEAYLGHLERAHGLEADRWADARDGTVQTLLMDPATGRTVA